MRVFTFQSGTIPAPVAAQEADVGPYRLRHEGDAVWPPKSRAYGGEPDPRLAQALKWVGMAGSLVLPVTLLTVILAAVYLYCDALLPVTDAPAMVQRALVSVSDFVLPAGWFAIHLTNRRYGASYAFVQLVAALVVGVLVMLFNPYDIDNWIAPMPVLTARAILSFGFAFLAANFFGIVMFDAARGPRWWTAPLAGSFAASLVFSALYYPAAFAGTGIAFDDEALVHLGLFLGLSVLFLAPYWLLRSVMRPLPGLNGY